MSEVICPRCSSDEYYTVQSGPHLKAICKICKNYIKFLPQEKGLPKFYFGKYVGQYVHDIQDLSYLQWASTNMTLKQPMRDAIIKRISSLENLGR